MPLKKSNDRYRTHASTHARIRACTNPRAHASVHARIRAPTHLHAHTWPCMKTELDPRLFELLLHNPFVENVAKHPLVRPMWIKRQFSQ